MHAAAGDLVWARSAGGVYNDNGFGIAVDAAGNALVTGRFDDSATFGAGEANETILTAAGVLTSSSPSTPQTGPCCGRARRAAEKYDGGLGIAVDAAGNALVTGRFEGSATFGAGEANETILTAAGDSNNSDIFIAQYAPDGTLLWARSAGGGSPEFGSGIAGDAAGNALVTESLETAPPSAPAKPMRRSSPRRGGTPSSPSTPQTGPCCGRAWRAVATS